MELVHCAHRVLSALREPEANDAVDLNGWLRKEMKLVWLWRSRVRTKWLIESFGRWRCNVPAIEH
jgi:hypothetical protein